MACVLGALTTSRATLPAWAHQPPARAPQVSVAGGRVVGITRRDTAAAWQIAVRFAPAGATSGVWLAGIAAGRSVVRDRDGRTVLLPGVQMGDSIIVWVHGPVLLSDPAYAFAESVQVAR